MTKVRSLALEDLIARFDELEDPRSAINRRHPLSSVLVIAVLAVLAGAGGPTAIACWAVLKRDLLVEILELPHGIPGKDVFRRVLMTIEPAAFQAAFAHWVCELRTKAEAETGVEQPILAVDGKTLRRSHDEAKDLGPLHLVSVWASEFGLSLGQLACAEKSNEITAIPELLRLVDLKGAIVTIDAMGTQKAIARRIVDGEGDYVLALKGNQETLHASVIQHFQEHFENGTSTAEELVTRETGHGRLEERRYLQLPAPRSLGGRQGWKGLESIGMTMTSSLRDGKESVEVRYYISSLKVDAREFARAVRTHWGIENGCHWTLDMTFREDESRTRQKYLRESLAWLNRFALSLLKQRADRQSVAMRRRSCGWSDEYLMEVVRESTC